MKVTVCELNAHPQHLEGEWQRLIDHVKMNGSDLVLLPEMPFSPWFGISASFDQVVWRSAVDAHERWLERLEELFPAIVLGSRPVDRNGLRLNEGFRWDREAGYTKVHDKYYLPDEPGFWFLVQQRRRRFRSCSMCIGEDRLRDMYRALVL